MKTQYEKDLLKARKFFGNIIKIAGELELYKMLYGELPTDKDSSQRILRMQQDYKDTKGLREIIAKFVVSNK